MIRSNLTCLWLAKGYFGGGRIGASPLAKKLSF